MAVRRLKVLLLSLFPFLAGGLSASSRPPILPHSVEWVEAEEGVSVNLMTERVTLPKGGDEELGENNTYAEDTYILEYPGFPPIPYVAKALLIPPGCEPRLILEELEADTLPALEGSNETELWRIGRDQYPGSENSSIFTTTPFPPHPVEVTEPAILRGFRIVTLRFYPYRYIPSSHQWVSHRVIRARVEWEDRGVEGESSPPPQMSGFVQRLLPRLVLNPPDLLNASLPLVGRFLYIIPNVQGIDQELAPLLEWRQRQGHRVKVIRMGANPTATAVRDSIRAAYNSPDPVEFVTLVGEATLGAQVWLPAATQTGDYLYTLLDGNDPLPDIALGRLSCTTLAQLRTIINKIVPYESSPHFQDTTWYLQGAVVAGYQGNGLSEVLTAIYVRKELLGLGFSQVRKWLWTENGNIGGDQPFLTQAFEWGISCLFYRAYNRMNNLNPQVIWNLRNREKFPAVIAISCNTGTFVGEESFSEVFLKSQGGGIGAIGTATGSTNVRFNNLLSAATWRGIYLVPLYSMGWGLNYGKYELWRAYEGFDQEYLNFMEWNNLMGDPGTLIWTKVPRRIAVDHPRQIDLATSSLTITVTDQRTGDPVEGAQVCLYLSGVYQEVEVTDNEGKAHFFPPSGRLREGTLKVTVTAPNLKPYLGDITVAPAQISLLLDEVLLDDDRDGLSQGNGDGIVNNGERVELTFRVLNQSDNWQEGEVSLEWRSLSPWMELVQSQASWDNLPRAHQTLTASAVFAISPAAPDGALLPLSLIIRKGGQVWQLGHRLDVHSPHIQVRQILWRGAPPNRGEAGNFDLVLGNVGHNRVSSFQVALAPHNPMVEAVVAQGDYLPQSPGQFRSAESGPFRLRVHPQAVPSTIVPIRVIIRAQDGFTDTLSTSFIIGRTGGADPLGPDNYGYVCWDSGDTLWDQRPTFRWIEINPQANPRDFNGTILNLRDNGDNDDSSLVVDLPFEFTYYGQRYRRLTICTNGWAALGEEGEFSDFRNQHIGQALGPRALLAVWWDNLITVQGSAICTYHDREGGRFIVEWYRMRRLLDGGGGGAWETFQLILYNPQVYPTPTGDGEIVFQYLEVTNENARAHNDIPFCTIGIQSPDGWGGLEYTYWNTYPPGARPIASRMALKFTTNYSYPSGVVRGVVRDASTGDPIPNAEVFTSTGYWAKSDPDGQYVIDGVRVRERWDITARALGWNDSTLGSYQINQGETLTVNFRLTHPSFELSPDAISISIRQGDHISRPLTIRNQGNGNLTWIAQKRAPEGDNAPWGIVTTIPVTRITGDTRIEGAVWIGDTLYVAGAAGNEASAIYVISQEGDLVRRFNQHGESIYGYRDLAYDGRLIWGSGERTIYGFTSEGELVRTINGPIARTSAITWDSDRRLLWVADITTNLYGIDLNGNVIHNIPRGNIRPYGLGYFPEDPQGKPLYVLSRDANTGAQQVYRLNPAQGSSEIVAELANPSGSSPGGVFITPFWDSRSWTFFAIIKNVNNQGEEVLNLYYLAPRTDWFNLSRLQDLLPPNSSQEVELSIDATALTIGEYEAEILFWHNAARGKSILPIRLEVRAPAGGEDLRWLSLQEGWNAVSLNIEPPHRELPDLLGPIIEEGILALVKDGRGRFYDPARNFNNIGEWNAEEGYLMFLRSPYRWRVEGVTIPEDRPIPLRSGWNLIPYYPLVPMSVELALETLGENLMVAKNHRGQFYLPRWGFSNMDPLQEGEAYWVRVAQADTLIFSRRGVVAQLSASPSAQGHKPQGLFTAPTPSRSSGSLVHFQRPAPGEVSMVGLILGEPSWEGWELKAVSPQGKILGAGWFDHQGRCGIALWGDEKSENGGSTSADLQPFIQWYIWDGKEEKEVIVDILEGENRWEPNGVLVGRVKGLMTPEDEDLLEAYPNPFNSSLSVRFQAGQPGTYKVNLLDLSGRSVITLFQGEVAEKKRVKITADAVHLPSGVYLLRLEGPETFPVKVKKLLLLK